MLVSLAELLYEAQKKQYAIGAFNTPSLEAIRAVIAAAEELSLPVIISHAEVHQKFVPIEIIGPIMLAAAKSAEVPVCVHLDHGRSLELIYKAMDMGFTSVMFDGSNLPYEKNIEVTCQIVKDAHHKGISVEAELGTMIESEHSTEITSSKSDINYIYTDPDLAADFVQRTGINALAASFGTVHGLYLTSPKLDFQRLSEIYKKTMVPIVMHGGSGLGEKDYHKAIVNGVRKINYYTYMARDAGETIREKLTELRGPVFYHDITSWAIDSMKQHAMKVMKIFAMKSY
uniref:class II fructose-bisphosphate aldolase n=1 Tax=Caldanaerobius polysaccharolyticus TaxID=44256 RepID=UPI0004793B08